MNLAFSGGMVNLRPLFSLRLLSVWISGIAGVSADPGPTKFTYSHGNPTALEQFALEMVNRARHDPAAEAAKLGVELNAGLPENTIAADAKPPLAFHPSLLAAARRHSLWMLEKNEFSHTGENGSNAGERMAAAGYRFLAPYLWGENIGWQGSTGAIRPVELIQKLHQSVFASPTHRLNLMDPEHLEVGLGVEGGEYEFEGQTYQAFFLTQNFACSAGTRVLTGPLLTGVAYRDGNGNGQYDPGEGKAGIRLSIEGGQFETVTSSSGGYALPVGRDFGPQVRLVAQETGRPREIRDVELIGSRNVKVDFVELVLPRRVLIPNPAVVLVPD